MDIKEYKLGAIKKWSKSVCAFFEGGSGEEVTLDANEASFARFSILPKMLRGVVRPDTSVHLYNQLVDMPILVAPMAFQRLAHQDGELETAKGVFDAKSLMVLSAYSTTPYETIANSELGARWFQLYMLKDRKLTEEMVSLAESLKFQALVVTVDAPVYAKRMREQQTPLPEDILLPDLSKFFGGSGPLKPSFLSSFLENSITWKDIEYLKTITKLPIILKGILRSDDALQAISSGCDGVILSNHGGRQLDTTPPAILVLENVAKKINGKIKIFLDGGIRSGLDVFKAIALGADAVLIGRPVLWGLTLNGREGVRDVLVGMHNDLRQTMVLSGCQSLDEVTSDLILKEGIK